MPRRKTHEEYEHEITKKFGRKYSLKSKYINTKIKIDFYCNVCERKHSMIAQHLLNNGCSLCGSKLGALKNTLTEEQFIERLFKVHGNIIINRDNYVRRDEKIRFYSYICKHEWKGTPDSVLSGNRCNVCALERSIITRTKTHENFLKEVYDLVGEEYSLLEKYEKVNVKIKFKHINCNKVFSMTPHSFLSGRRCPHCFGTPKKTTGQFKEEVFQLVGNEYEILSEYHGNKVNITFRHLNCKTTTSYTFKMRPNSFLSGHRCPNCSPSKKDTQDSFTEKLLRVKGKDYKLISEYSNSWTKVLIHHKCGFKWSVTPSNVLNDQDCPLCFKMQKVSKGERRIIKYLIDRKIEFEIEKTFPNLKYKKNLRYDFAVFFNNKMTLIEFNGIQHYIPIKHFDRESGFKGRKVRDNLKEKYAKDYNIPFLTIPYWDYKNIPQILDNTFQTPENFEIK